MPGYDPNGNLLSASMPLTTPSYGYGTQPWGSSPYGGQQGSPSTTRADYFVYDALDRPIQRTILGVFEFSAMRSFVKWRLRREGAPTASDQSAMRACTRASTR